MLTIIDLSPREILRSKTKTAIPWIAACSLLVLILGCLVGYPSPKLAEAATLVNQ
jgi:hypothetical protein